MEVLLLRDVAKLGRKGDVVKVAPGFARNYLFPRNAAVPATERNRGCLAAQAKRSQLRAAQALEAARETAARLTNVSLIFRKLANDNGDLYGSVTAAEVSEALAHDGFDVDKRHISFEVPVTRLGSYAATVKLAEDLLVHIPLTVLRPEG